MNKWAELLIGMILLVVVVYAFGMYSGIRTTALEFLKGGIFWLIAMIGLLFVVLGISDLKD